MRILKKDRIKFFDFRLERESEGESSYPMCSTSELSYIHKPLTCMEAHPEINVSKRTDFRTDFQIPERDCCNRKEPLEFSQDKSFLTDFSPSYWPYSSLNQFCHDLCSLHLHTVQKVLTKDSSTCTGSCYTSNMECQCYIKPRKTFLSKLCSFLTK